MLLDELCLVKEFNSVITVVIELKFLLMFLLTVEAVFYKTSVKVEQNLSVREEA